MDPTQRFSTRVEHYVRHRPEYPAAVLDVLRGETGLTPASVIADVGSGTGISAALFLANGNHVSGGEPNAGMRAAAEQLLASYPNFYSIAGTAEATTLPDASADYVVAGQAFHWFDRPRARVEFARILRSGGWVVLLWNTRRNDTPFGRDYEALLREFGTDYERVRHENISAAELAAFFAPGRCEKREVPNPYRLDWEGLTGRLLSSTYVPAEGDPRHGPMLASLEGVFRKHESGGRVPFDYTTELYVGRIS